MSSEQAILELREKMNEHDFILKSFGELLTKIDKAVDSIKDDLGPKVAKMYDEYEHNIREKQAYITDYALTKKKTEDNENDINNVGRKVNTNYEKLDGRIKKIELRIYAIGLLGAISLVLLERFI